MRHAIPAAHIIARIASTIILAVLAAPGSNKGEAPGSDAFTLASIRPLLRRTTEALPSNLSHALGSSALPVSIDHVAREAFVGSVSDSLLQNGAGRSDPYSMDTWNWDYSENVTFNGQQASIPQGGWIQSKDTLTRPTIVEAQIRSDDANSGCIGMTLFGTEHDITSATRYSIQTGYEPTASTSTGTADYYKIYPGPAVGVHDYNNRGVWDTVRIELTTSGFMGFINSGIQVTENADTADQPGWQQSGKVQFIAKCRSMEVQGVQWQRNCEFSAWVAEDCSVTCGDGTRVYRRDILKAATMGGSCSDQWGSAVHRTDTCHMQTC